MQSPSWRRSAAFFHDVLVAVLAWFVAYLLRFNFKIPVEFTVSIWQVALFVIPLQVLFFIQFGLYKGVWRFASLPDLKRILMAISTAAITVVALLFMFKPVGIVVPRAVLVLNPILLMLMMGGSRFVYRSWKEHKLYGFNQMRGEPVLVLGAGEAAIALLKDLERSQEWRVIGLLDDDAAIHGREIMGIKVLGEVAQLPEIAKSLDISNVIIAKPADAHQARRRAIEIASGAGLQVFTIPSVEDLMSGNIKISKIRHVEIEDLLGRDAVQLDNSGLQHLIEGNAVLVSGAGGSIGSELCRQIVKYKPDTLVCLDISELALYNLEQEFSREKTSTKLFYMTGDVKNSQRVKSLLEQFQPEVVFHAAAYKHVPLMENGNVWEALSNNVIGTYTLAKACKEAAVGKFVLISTDKAVNPTNVMGASKRLAEMVCQGLQEDFSEDISKDISNKSQLGNDEVTRFVIVRFGNVLGSSGSVIPKFREQIAKGGPVTITHPDITRYFMSIPEAAQLVMQAGLMGNGGEIFVLDMGEPVKIAALAADMIRLSGLQADEIKIEYVGLRPGEKLYEELLADDEHTMLTPHEKLRIAQARQVDNVWVKKLLKWIESTQNANEAHIKNELKFWVEEYTPQHQVSAEALFILDAEQVTLH
ncbi:MAG: nucleoside-diphosphate sugar epimerase/dehydratase [Methylotenera sp.]|nr:nucleoside-diphosphate sugar epimerase/dehydratase [Methylotenera sp.]